MGYTIGGHWIHKKPVKKYPFQWEWHPGYWVDDQGKKHRKKQKK